MGESLKLLPYLMPMLGERIETQDKDRTIVLAAAIRSGGLNSTYTRPSPPALKHLQRISV